MRSLVLLGFLVLLFDFLEVEQRWQALLDLVQLLRVRGLEDQGVQVSLAPDLQLNVLALGVFLDAGALCILSPSELKELLDVCGFGRHLNSIFFGLDVK